MFIDDNDDEFKIYQKEFRKLQIEITQKNLDKELNAVKDSREKFEERLVATQEIYSSHANEVASIEKALSDLQGKFYKANMNYQGQKDYMKKALIALLL